jgi:hypothetical protein
MPKANTYRAEARDQHFYTHLLKPFILTLSRRCVPHFYARRLVVLLIARRTMVLRVERLTVLASAGSDFEYLDIGWTLHSWRVWLNLY